MWLPCVDWIAPPYISCISITTVLRRNHFQRLSAILNSESLRCYLMMTFADDAFSNLVVFFAKPVCSTPPRSPQTILGRRNKQNGSGVAEGFDMLGDHYSVTRLRGSQIHTLILPFDFPAHVLPYTRRMNEKKYVNSMFRIDRALRAQMGGLHINCTRIKITFFGIPRRSGQVRPARSIGEPFSGAGAKGIYFTWYLVQDKIRLFYVQQNSMKDLQCWSQTSRFIAASIHRPKPLYLQ